MTINEATRLLSNFADELHDLDEQANDAFSSLTPIEAEKATQQLLEDYAMKIIDKGQWE